MDASLLIKDFAKAAADSMSLRELVDAWDKICLPQIHEVDGESRALLREIFETNRKNLSGA